MEHVSPSYEQQLESLARTLTERFKQEVVIVNPLSIPRDESIERTDIAQQDFNRWCDQGTYLDRD
jgi:hypothetical protein